MTAHGGPGGPAAVPPPHWHGSKEPCICPGLEDGACHQVGGGGCSHRMQKVICTNVWLPLPWQTVASAVWWFVSVILKFGSPCDEYVKKRDGVANEGSVFLKGL